MFNCIVYVFELQIDTQSSRCQLFSCGYLEIQVYHCFAHAGFEVVAGVGGDHLNELKHVDLIIAFQFV